jgi:hypothetical protein
VIIGKHEIPIGNILQQCFDFAVNNSYVMQKGDIRRAITGPKIFEPVTAFTFLINLFYCVPTNSCTGKKYFAPYSNFPSGLS